MGKVSGNWVTGTHTGRACKHDDIYTKVKKRTGACYSVKLCNPVTEQNAEQMKSTGAFSLVSSAISAWIKTNKASQSADYSKVQKAFEAQKKYSFLRSFMFAKGMYTVSADKKTVTADITARTDFKTAFGIESSSGTPSAGSVTGGPTPSNDPEPVKYTLAISSDNESQGTVNTSVNGEYDANSSVTITATPATGYTFDKWSDENTYASRVITMNENKTLTAYFKVASSEENAGGGESQGGGVNNLH